MAASYVGQFLRPALSGRLDAQLGLNWQAAMGDKPPALQLTAPRIAVSDMLLAQGKTALLSLQRADLTGVDIDVPGQAFKAAKMQISQPRARVERDADKRWMYERWLVGQGMALPPSVDTATDPKAAAKANAPSWAVAINDVSLDGGVVSFSDRAGAKPVAFEVTALTAQLGGLLLGDRPAGKALADRRAHV